MFYCLYSQKRYKHPGFTLIELLVVIAIIGILSTLAIIALGNARQKARDTKRVADVGQISKALELYFSDNNSYPAIITPGQPLRSPDNLTTYLSTIPANPSPRNDGSCQNNDYIYTYTNDGYAILGCLGAPAGSLSAGSFVAGSSGQASVGSTNGLVGYWRFDESGTSTVYDISGVANHATLTMVPPSVTMPTRVGGGPGGGGAVSFNGGFSQYMTIPDNASVDFTTALTMSMWYKRDASTLVTFGKYAASGNRSYVMEVYPNNYLYFSVSGDGTTIISYRSTAAAMPADGTWHHIAATYDGSSIVLYKDGAVLPGSVLAGSIPASLYNSSANLENRYTTNNFTTGTMDNIRVYNRALSAAEILEIYNTKQ